jgi:hypothetical protein
VVPDVGMMAGRFFNAVGKAEIRAMKALWMPYRRSRIKRAFPHTQSSAKGLGSMYDDLIDFTR